ncbi:hypothetical protein Tco_0022404 [Tanacetum coccineum]
MCIDFKNLNSACPKDYYPLPNIDCKVEAVMGFKYKCFLDAYKGYHQIQMAKEDEEKIAFYTEQGTQIGRNLEAYVDDMVIKSKQETSLLADIAETFEVNPKKTRAISDLQSPKTLKEMQSLSGKLASLNRFLAKSAERVTSSHLSFKLAGYIFTSFFQGQMGIIKSFKPEESISLSHASSGNTKPGPFHGGTIVISIHLLSNSRGGPDVSTIPYTPQECPLETSGGWSIQECKQNQDGRTQLHRVLEDSRLERTTGTRSWAAVFSGFRAGTGLSVNLVPSAG